MLFSLLKKLFSNNKKKHSDSAKQRMIPLRECVLKGCHVRTATDDLLNTELASTVQEIKLLSANIISKLDDKAAAKKLTGWAKKKPAHQHKHKH